VQTVLSACQRVSGRMGERSRIAGGLISRGASECHTREVVKGSEVIQLSGVRYRADKILELRNPRGVDQSRDVENR
jgi:hypothetical protein